MSKERARKVTIKLQSAANRCHWFSSTELAVFLRTGGTCWMSHNEVPVFLSKIMYMMHACCRRVEDCSPGLLEAANVNVMDVMEFEARPKAGATPPNPSDRAATPATQQSRVDDVTMGDEREGRVAAEPADDDSDHSSHNAGDQANDTSDDDEELHGDSDRDAEPLAQADNSGAGSTASGDDSDYLPSIHLHPQTETRVTAITNRTRTSQCDYMQRPLAVTAGYIADHRCIRCHTSSTCITSNDFEKRQRHKHPSKSRNVPSSTDTIHYLPCTSKEWSKESSHVSLACNANSMKKTMAKTMLYGTWPFSD
jgi:hypothetical protein